MDINKKNTFEVFIKDFIADVAEKGDFPADPYPHLVESASDYYNSSDLQDLAIAIDGVSWLFGENDDASQALQEELLEKYLPENLREHVALCRELALREALENKKVVEEARNKNKAERENPKTNIEPSSIIKPK